MLLNGGDRNKVGGYSWYLAIGGAKSCFVRSTHYRLLCSIRFSWDCLISVSRTIPFLCFYEHSLVLVLSDLCSLCVIGRFWACITVGYRFACFLR